MKSAAAQAAFQTLVPVLVLGASACSSQIDNIPTPDVAANSSSPGGIYIGQDNSQSSTTPTTVIALVDENQDVDLYAGNGSYLLSGLYAATSTNGISAQARYFPLSDAGGSASTVNLVGSFSAQTQILASYTRSDGSSGSYNLSYQASLYQLPSTLATLEGSWVVEDSFGAIVTSFNFDGNGGVSGSTSSPDCSYTGQAAIIDLRFNVYGLSLNESCTFPGSSGASTTVNATLSGLATLLPASTALGTTQSQLVLTGASTSEGRLFLLNPHS
jgi:hypothetical protein